MFFHVGTAGWTVPKQHLHLPVAAEGAQPSHLERYAQAFSGVEINSSFYRPHRRSTWERWAASTPEGFRFAVKAPKAVTHTAKLINTGASLLEFFDGVRGLGEKLGPVLVQLPPKLAYDDGIAQEFFSTLRELHTGATVLEPRHPSWFAAPVDQVLRSFAISRVAADPPVGSERAARPGGWEGLSYYRLHGSPRTYYSTYEDDWLHAMAHRLSAPPPKNEQTWVIFDNTALGHAFANAARLQSDLRAGAEAAADVCRGETPGG